MGRVKENKEEIESVMTTVENGCNLAIGSIDAQQTMINTCILHVLVDISKSLAVIADGIDDVKNYVNE